LDKSAEIGPMANHPALRAEATTAAAGSAGRPRTTPGPA